MPLETQVIYSKAALDITCRPYLVGEKLGQLAKTASEDFFRATDLEALGERPVSLEILNGGRFYYLAAAYTSVTDKPCKVATLRAKRKLDPTTKHWMVDVWDENLSSLADCTSVLIGDTVATGTTLVGVLDHVLKVMEENDNPRDIHIFTIAGSYACEPGLEKFAERLAQVGKKLRLVYCNCKFGLADNGTDMKFADATDMHPDARMGLREAIPEGFEKRMRCAVWDWGDRFTQPLQHLDEVTEYFHSIGGVPRWLQDGLNLSYEEAKAVENQASKLQKVNSRKQSIW